MCFPPQLLAPLGLYIGLAAGGLAALRAGDRPAAFGLAWLVGTFLPAANLFFPVATVVGERLLYLPSGGACLLSVHLLHQLWQSHHRCGLGGSPAAGKLLLLAGCGLLAAMAARCGARTAAWHDDLTLWQSAVHTARTFPHPYVPCVCVCFQPQGAAAAPPGGLIRTPPWAVSRVCVSPKVHAVPSSARAHYNLGSALLPAGAAAARPASAAFIRALEIDGSYEPAWPNLGAALEARQEWGLAVLAYEAGLSCHRTLAADNRSASAVKGDGPRRELYMMNALGQAEPTKDAAAAALALVLVIDLGA